MSSEAERPQGIAAEPDAENVFAPVADRYGPRLALVFGSHARDGICPYYRAGSCYHCDIGAGEGGSFDLATNRARLAWFQHHYADQLDAIAHLVLYNSGSVLHRLEMPRELLLEILATVRPLPALRVVSIESREAYVDQETVVELAAALAPHQCCRIVLGLETADDYRRERLLNKTMPRRVVARAFDALAAAAAEVGPERVGVDVNLVVGGPGTDSESAIDDAVDTARFALGLGRERALSVDLNLHPYYPSRRSRARFPDQPRCPLDVLARAVTAACQIAEEIGGDPMFFIGGQDEGHDTEPSARAAELARAAQLCDRFNREQDPALLATLLR